jgi:hypothetical protein
MEAIETETARVRMAKQLIELGSSCHLASGGIAMPEKKTTEKARRALRQGKRPTTAAGEFVHEEIDHVREGKHGARSTKQAIAIGLSKARRAGVPLKPPRAGQASKRTRRSAQRDVAKGRAAVKGGAKKPSARRSRATTGALKREGRGASSRRALSRQAKQAARRRGPTARKRSAAKAARTRARRSRR